jgi:hypothetical protein
MNIPQFTAQASLYRTSNRYRSSSADCDGSIPTQSVVAAYIPGPETQNKCSGCIQYCVVTRNICLAKAGVVAFESCLGTGPLFPLCFAGAIVFYGAGCYSGYAACFGTCHIPGDTPFSGPCCPKPCGFHTPGIEGSGCCDLDETCVGSGHANTRDGCCPVGQYCAGNCCATVGSCCGGTCCPAGFSCIGDVCTTGFPNTPPPPPPPPVNNCIFGGEPCGKKCCFGDFVCCHDPWEGPVCRQPPCLH